MRGLYDPDAEKSSCGVGLLTRKDGRQTHEVIQKLHLLCKRLSISFFDLPLPADDLLHGLDEFLAIEGERLDKDLFE